MSSLRKHIVGNKSMILATPIPDVVLYPVISSLYTVSMNTLSATGILTAMVSLTTKQSIKIKGGKMKNLIIGDLVKEQKLSKTEMDEVKGGRVNRIDYDLANKIYQEIKDRIEWPLESMK